MATRQLPPSYNPYAGGAVVVDSTPYAMYYLRQQAEEKAKNEALDKYFTDLGNSVSSAGTDYYDLPAIQLMKENWQKHYQSNRDLIKTRKDGGKAYMDNMKMFGEIKNLIEQSKQKTGQLAQINEFRLKNPDAIIDEDALMEIDKTRQPIKRVVSDAVGGKHLLDNNDWSPLDFGKFQPVKPLTQQELLSINRSYLQGVKPSQTRTFQSISERDPLFDVIQTESAYDRTQLSSAAQQAMNYYDASKPLRYTLKQSQPTPEELQKLDEVYKYVFGPSATINTPKEVYAARVILENMGVSSVSEEKENKTRAMEAQAAKERSLASFRAGLDKQVAEYKEALKSGTSNEWLENQVRNLESDPQGTLRTTSPDGSVQDVKVLKVHTPVKKMFAVDGEEPDLIVQLPNGDVQGRFYAKDETGTVVKKNGRNVIAESKIPITLNRQQFKAAYGDVLTSGKDLTGQLQTESAPQPKPSGKGKGKKLY